MAMAKMPTKKRGENDNVEEKSKMKVEERTKMNGE